MPLGGKVTPPASGFEGGAVKVPHGGTVIKPSGVFLKLNMIKNKINMKKVREFLSHQSAPIAVAAAKTSPNSAAKINFLFYITKLVGLARLAKRNNLDV